MSEKMKREDNQPGMDKKRDVPNENEQTTRQSAESGEQGRASYHPGSTTQGGSNHGQGSMHLGGDSYHQGDEKSRGSNYDNERGKLSETRDDVPHGQGAHVNEKESNAQEDYPGTQEPDQDAPEKDII